MLDGLADDYDLAFVDCAPHLSLVSENIFEMADHLLVPVIPTPLSVRAYAQLREFCGAHGLDRDKLLPFFSMVDRRRQLHCELITSFAAEHLELHDATKDVLAATMENAALWQPTKDIGVVLLWAQRVKVAVLKGDSTTLGMFGGFQC